MERFCHKLNTVMREQNIRYHGHPKHTRRCPRNQLDRIYTNALENHLEIAQNLLAAVMGPEFLNLTTALIRELRKGFTTPGDPTACPVNRHSTPDDGGGLRTLHETFALQACLWRWIKIDRLRNSSSAQHWKYMRLFYAAYFLKDNSGVGKMLHHWC